MQISFQAIHFVADQKLKDLISERLEKLSKFHAKIIKATVFMKLENSGQIKDKIVEIKLSIPGHTLIGANVDKTFEGSFDDALESVKRQLVKLHDKQIVQSRQ
jgi:putative sigma-54 modulation protein